MITAELVKALVLSLYISPALAQDDQQRVDALKALSIEELASLDVTTAGRRSERITDVPAAVSVVTAEDIRRYAATTLAETLRLADGLHVSRFDGRTYGVSARGFNISTSNKMLVMMDGRSLWTPLFSGVLWDEHDAIMADIERIEVVRGPGGTLWGANAINGVINIVSRPAADTIGTYGFLAAGTEERLVAAIRHGAPMGQQGAWRAYAKLSFVDDNRFANGSGSDDEQRRGFAGARAGPPVGANDFVIQADGYKAALGLFDRDDTDIHGANMRGRWTRGAASGAQLQVQAVAQYSYRNVPLQFEERRRTASIDAQQSFRIGRHDVVAGASAEVTRDRTAQSPVLYFDPSSRTLSLFSVFAQDDITVVRGKLWVSPGLKLLKNSYTGVETHPGLRVRFVPAAGHTLWAATSRAVRLPSRFDRDLRFTGTLSRVVVAGSENFMAETVTAIEGGYRAQLSSRVSFDAAAFSNRYDKLRSQSPGGPIGLATLANDLNGRSKGLELSLHAQLMPGLRAHASYTRLATSTSVEPGRTIIGNAVSEFNDPDHQAALRLYADLPRGFELDAFGRYVSALPHPVVPAYGELDARFGWVSPGGHEIALVGRNLLHGRHPEFNPPGPRRYEFERAVTLRSTWRF